MRKRRRWRKGSNSETSETWAGIGMAWAKFGINMGRAALEGSAETLRTTMDAIEKISGQMPERCGPPSEREPWPEDDPKDNGEREPEDQEKEPKAE